MYICIYIYTHIYIYIYISAYHLAHHLCVGIGRHYVARKRSYVRGGLRRRHRGAHAVQRKPCNKLQYTLMVLVVARWSTKKLARYQKLFVYVRSHIPRRTDSYAHIHTSIRTCIHICTQKTTYSYAYKRRSPPAAARRRPLAARRRPPPPPPAAAAKPPLPPAAHRRRRRRRRRRPFDHLTPPPPPLHVRTGCQIHP